MNRPVTGWRRLLRLVNEFAPMLAVVMLIAAPAVLPTVEPLTPAMIERTERIVKAIEQAPWVVGRWTGRGVTVPPSAWRILKPSAILSRRYRETSHDADSGRVPMDVTFTVVHCTNLRDMQGHYPPICYPAHGWRTNDASTRVIVWRDSSIGEASVMFYEFDQRGVFGDVQTIRVLNFFIMPNGMITPDMDGLRSMARWRGASNYGIAQVQLVGGASLDPVEGLKILSEMVDGMPELFGVLMRKGEETGHG